jgi:hypothetical protein
MKHRWRSSAHPKFFSVMAIVGMFVASKYKHKVKIYDVALSAQTPATMQLSGCSSEHVVETTLVTTVPRSFFTKERLSLLPHLLEKRSLKHLNTKLLIYSEDDLSDVVKLAPAIGNTCNIETLQLLHEFNDAQLQHIKAHSKLLHDAKRSRNLFLKVLAISKTLSSLPVGHAVMWVDMDVVLQHKIDQKIRDWIQTHDVSSIFLCSPSHKERECLKTLGRNRSKLKDDCECAFETGIMLFRVSDKTRQLAGDVLLSYYPKQQSLPLQNRTLDFMLAARALDPIFNIGVTLNDVAVWSYIIFNRWAREEISVGFLAGEISKVTGSWRKMAWERDALLYKDAGKGMLVLPQTESELVSPFNIFYYASHFRGLKAGLARSAVRGL